MFKQSMYEGGGGEKGNAMHTFTAMSSLNAAP